MKLLSIGMVTYERAGMEISYVTEIVGIHAVTVMPDMPDYINGIMNLRDVIVRLMDISLQDCEKLLTIDEFEDISEVI